MQVRHDKHHREKQHDRAEVDEAEGILDAYGARHEHQHGTDDGRAWAVNFHPWEFSQGKNYVARNENRIRAYGCEFGHLRLHGGEHLSFGHRAGQSIARLWPYTRST